MQNGLFVQKNLTADCYIYEMYKYVCLPTAIWQALSMHRGILSVTPSFYCLEIQWREYIHIHTPSPHHLL